MKTLTINVEEAGRILGLSRGSTYRAVKAGEIPALRVGRRLVVPVPTLAQKLGIDVGKLLEMLEMHEVAHGR